MAEESVVVTGATGFIGSHMVLKLLEEGKTVHAVDNLYNSDAKVLERIRELAPAGPSLVFHNVDIRDKDALSGVFAAATNVVSVIHFAGLKAVGESMAEPLKYYTNNLVGTINLVEVMAAAGVKALVFSSSCTVYGNQKVLPITEDSPRGPESPYGRTKYTIEVMLEDVAASDPEWNIVSLRYFNPCGAHPSGRLGEDPQGAPMNLVPIVSQVALGLRDKLMVFGNDYATHDGTAVRDYIHIMDLIDGHAAALAFLAAGKGDRNCVAFNLGLGVPISVLDVVAAMEAASGKPIPYEVAPRRPGDVEAAYADPSAARDALGWEAKMGIDVICQDSWKWWIHNPQGYATPADFVPDL